MKVWLLHDSNPGDTASGRALVDALGWETREIDTSRFVEEDRLIDAFRFLPPPPYPQVALCTSNSIGVFFLRALKLRSPRTFCVQLGFMPVGAAALFDLMPFVPVYSYPPHSRAVKTTGVLTPVNDRLLAVERERWRSSLIGLREKKVGVFIGARAVHCRLGEHFFPELIKDLLRIEKDTACSFLICTNRRITPTQVSFLRQTFSSENHRVFAYDGSEPERNPYWGYLAHSDACIVSCDSLSMISDAMATRRAVYVAGLKTALRGGWATFFEDLKHSGRIQDLDSPFLISEVLHPPINEAVRIARRIQNEVAHVV
jgi:mitochondrial fission protein ELM1